jgi:dihydrolipoamide dehydrogenase
MDYDLVVIGAGWAGFNACLRAKELNLKVALIEKEQVGGTCLNRGCIPTKTLIQSAKIFGLVKKSSQFGVEISTSATVNFLKIQERKEKIIQQLRSGMQFLLKGIDFMPAEAVVMSAQEVRAGDKTIKTNSILIATGSRPIELANLKFDGKKIISSDQILNLKEIPKSLLIIGGGVIGCEFACLFSALGAQVTVVEKMLQILPGEDKEVARKLEGIMKKKGIKVLTNTDATMIDMSGHDFTLLCIGRIPSLSGDLDKLGIKTEKGRIIVDEYLRTNIGNIYAAGDCTGKVQLAHFAAYQGRLAAENIARGDRQKKFSSANIPNCIFTDPEVASVGTNEEAARNSGIDIRVSRFDFLGSGMARILDETEGFIKILSNELTGQALGASIIGPRATELIAVLTLAIQSRLNIRQIKETIFAHPTLSESISEAIKLEDAA